MSVPLLHFFVLKPCRFRSDTFTSTHITVLSHVQAERWYLLCFNVPGRCGHGSFDQFFNGETNINTTCLFKLHTVFAHTVFFICPNALIKTRCTDRCFIYILLSFSRKNVTKQRTPLCERLRVLFCFSKNFETTIKFSSSSSIKY